MGLTNRSFHAQAAKAGVFVRSLTGWRRHLLAFTVGLFSALSFAPFGIFPFLLLAFAVLVLLIDGAQTLKRPIWGAAFVGWTFGFGHFLAGLYWVGYAFTVDASAHAWQIPFVAVLFPGWLAVYLAVGCGVASALWQPGAARIFIFSAAYGAAEWVRGHFLTGFPWNLPAYGWGASLGVLQSAALIGAYGLSLLTVLLGASLARFCDARLPGLPAAHGDDRVVRTDLDRRRRAPGDGPSGEVPGVRLRLVQPNVPQNEKFLRRYVARNWQELLDLSNAHSDRPITHLIWPEAAPPFLLTREAVALDDIAVLTNGNRVLLTGAERVLATPDGDFHYFNSLYIFAHGGQLLDVYDKFHLVPFGEYLPFSDLLTALGISKLVDSPGGFTPGDGPHSYSVPGAPAAGPLICYEILFPSAVVGSNRPGWFVNVTDDSWFGPSTGPYQHLLTARVRAIEEGIPVARAANTGISAVIDPLGQVTASLGLGRVGVVDANLPEALGRTPYAQFGDLAFVLLLIACVVGGSLGPLTTKADRS